MNKGKVINKPLEARKASPLLVSVSAVILGMLAGCILYHICNCFRRKKDPK